MPLVCLLGIDVSICRATMMVSAIAGQSSSQSLYDPCLNSFLSGNGACLTLKEMARFAYNEQKELAGTTYADAWDAE